MFGFPPFTTPSFDPPFHGALWRRCRCGLNASLFHLAASSASTRSLCQRSSLSAFPVVSLQASSTTISRSRSARLRSSLGEGGKPLIAAARCPPSGRPSRPHAPHSSRTRISSSHNIGMEAPLAVREQAPARLTAGVQAEPRNTSRGATLSAAHWSGLISPSSVFH